MNLHWYKISEVDLNIFPRYRARRLHTAHIKSECMKILKGDLKFSLIGVAKAPG